jgi:hypothetical protein
MQRDRHWAVSLSKGSDDLCRMNGFHRTNVGASTAIGAHFRINLINIAFGNGFYRTLIDASATGNAIFTNNMSHDTTD